MKKTIIVLLPAVLLAGLALAGQTQKTQVNLLSLHEGTFPVTEPESYGGWPVEGLLDESPKSGWACPDGKTANNVFVFEMVAPAVLERFEFDNAGIDEEGAGAREVAVEVSAVGKAAGFATVLQATLAAQADNQGFKAATAVKGRWVRLTVRNNHGSASWTELLGFRGFGVKPTLAAPLGDVSGTYSTSYSMFHVRQQGTALVGCYESNDGLLDGAIEGRVMKITWRENEGKSIGPAVMVFAADGKSFRGYWWHKGGEEEAPHGRWDGEKTGAQVGGCPHWSGSLEGEMKKQLAGAGRVRVYGILFDLDSATIRPESRPVLDEVLGLLRSEPGWKLTIEGHTDATGGDAHNQELSLQRAGSVKAYLVAAGIVAEQLKTQGYGESKPVADNATELGRAQNRRVELVRQP
jgi:outer membrane protein OmpA-like peptidoglycan-associated protein